MAVVGDVKEKEKGEGTGGIVQICGLIGVLGMYSTGGVGRSLKLLSDIKKKTPRHSNVPNT